MTTKLDDPVWDEFLESSTLGHYQQSSCWARAKEATGWHSLRCALVRGGVIAGGFQLLHRTTRFGRLGYLPKGPVTFEDRVDVLGELVEVLRRQADDAGLVALIVQPPDDSAHSVEVLRRQGFQRAPFLGVIESTLVLPLEGSSRALEERMHRVTRRRIRQAQERGLTVREGGEADLPVFFDLMVTSCRRQRSEGPNPSSLEALQAVSDAFSRRQQIRLTLAERQGEIYAGLVCLCFGKRFSLWKKGWADEGQQLWPNYLLHSDAFSWAHQRGYAYCDFESLRRDIVETMLRGAELSPEQRKSRDYFNIRFGGVPKRLPSAMIFIRNPVLRSFLTAVGSTRFLMRALKGLSL